MKSYAKLIAAALLLALPACTPAATGGSSTSAAAPQRDGRIGLRAGWRDAGMASRGMELVAHSPRPSGFYNPNDMGDFGYLNSDMAFQGSRVWVGNFNGFQVYDIADPTEPKLLATHVCPGGQGDLSIWGDLLFMSVEEERGRVDCGTQGVRDSVSTERFQGVRIFDISNVNAPRQVAAVQTCRGSHTHTLAQAPGDDRNVYVYVQGTSRARPAGELAGCVGTGPQDPNTSYFQIEVIQVPLDAPQNARIVSEPRVFADPVTGNPAGLWPGGGHGPGTQETAMTIACHDITTYPEVGLAAGACSGNGILLDISDIVNPKRIEEVTDPNFAYWHSATFSNAADKVIFTDEWGGGVAPRCQATDRREWGADAIFTLQNGELTQKSYYKLPAPQTATENCVAHNGSLIPIPGRDVMVQAWYQGGVSVFDYTDPAHPFEIAYFDRGPMSATRLYLGGAWSSYWYNGRIYTSEIGRGLDVLKLTPSEHLSENEIRAAEQVIVNRFNPQHQRRIVWPRTAAVAGAYVDQLERAGALPAERIAEMRAEIASIGGDARALASMIDELEGMQDTFATALRSVR